jgi:hypothetical protein
MVKWYSSVCVCVCVCVCDVYMFVHVCMSMYVHVLSAWENVNKPLFKLHVVGYSSHARGVSRRILVHAGSGKKSESLPEK